MAVKVQNLDPEIISFITNVAELASLKTRIEDDKLSPYISLREASLKYGANVVKRWRNEGRIEFIKDGNRTSKIRIDRFKIAVVAKASNRS